MREQITAGKENQTNYSVVTKNELDRIRRQVIETKEDSYEVQRNLHRQELQ